MLNQLVRYEPVLRLIREVPGRTLLDVGSGSHGVSRHLGRAWAITALDASFDDYGAADGAVADHAERIVGDARDLPFADGTFDVVLALDLLEHVAPADRRTVLAELARVTARRLVAACPAGAAAEAADRALAEAYRRRGEALPGWLTEHLEHGFPRAEELEAALAPHGSVRLLGNESARAHGRLMRLEAGRRSGLVASAARRALSPALRPGPLQAPAAAAVRLVRGGDRPPTYRTIAVLDRG